MIYNTFLRQIRSIKKIGILFILKQKAKNERTLPFQENNTTQDDPEAEGLNADGDEKSSILERISTRKITTVTTTRDSSFPQ